MWGIAFLASRTLEKILEEDPLEESTLTNAAVSTPIFLETKALFTLDREPFCALALQSDKGSVDTFPNKSSIHHFCLSNTVVPKYYQLATLVSLCSPKPESGTKFTKL